MNGGREEKEGRLEMGGEEEEVNKKEAGRNGLCERERDGR